MDAAQYPFRIDTCLADFLGVFGRQRLILKSRRYQTEQDTEPLCCF